MNFDLLENGIDSLRQAKINIDENYLNHEFESFQLKDGLFNCVHGMEVLTKFIIKEKNEEDIFTCKAKYRAAVKQMQDHHKNVFDVNPKLRTINVSRALELLKTDFGLNESLYVKAIKLIQERNKLMHYTVEMSYKAKVQFAEELRSCIEQMTSYYAQSIPNFKVKFEQLERHYPYTEYDKWEDACVDAAESKYEEERWGIDRL